MNSLYNKNIQLFKTRFPSLFDQYKHEINTFLDTTLDFELTQSRSGHITAIQNNLALHSTYNPVREAQKLIASSPLGEKKAAVFLTCGLGYAPIAFIKEYPKETLIIIEPDLHFLLSVFASIDWEPIFKHEKLILLFRVEPQDIIAILEHTGLQDCCFFQNASQSAHCESYINAIQTLIERNKQKDSINNATLKKFAQLWLRNTLQNADFLIEKNSITEYKHTATDLSACVLAAGPNLDEAIPYLAQIKERCILICVDTALRACKMAGIQPHFILVGDPQYWNSLHLHGLSFPESVLVTEIAVYPSIFRFDCKEILLFNSLYPPGKALETEFGFTGELGAGGSVAASAWDFARHLGCKQIYFAGLDLGFPNKKTHFKGSTFEENVHSSANRFYSVDQANADVLFNAAPYYANTYDKKNILTDKRLSLYSWWFESKCAAYPEHKTFSLSENSLHIPGITFYSLTELSNLKPASCKINTFLESISQFTKKTTAQQEKKLAAALDSMHAEICAVSDMLTKAVNLSEKGLDIVRTDIEEAKKVSLILHEIYSALTKSNSIPTEYIVKYNHCIFERLDTNLQILTLEKIHSFFIQSKLYYKTALYFCQQIKSKKK